MKRKRIKCRTAEDALLELIYAPYMAELSAQDKVYMVQLAITCGGALKKLAYEKMNSGDNSRVKTRSQARRQGSDIYFTRIPCRNGHITDRFTVNGACVECCKKAKVKRGAAAKKERDRLNDSYVVATLVAQYEITRDQVTPELIEAKRNHLKQHRLIKEVKHGINK